MNPARLLLRCLSNIETCRAVLPVLEEEGLSSDLGHGVEHHGLRADVHGGHRALGGG